MQLDELLRACVLRSESIFSVAKAADVPQATLQEFVSGRADGSYPDLRLSTVQKLMEFFGMDQSLTMPSIQKRSIRMDLALELELCHCPDSPEKFKERLIDTLISEFPGTTIDALLCEPDNAISFCNAIRQGIGVEDLSDVVMLKTLLNIRKRKDCPPGLKKGGKTRLLERELVAAGCDMSPGNFRPFVVDCFASMYKSRTIDELLCHPLEAKMLCEWIRKQPSCEQLPNSLILSTLINVRKAGH